MACTKRVMRDIHSQYREALWRWGSPVYAGRLRCLCSYNCKTQGKQVASRNRGMKLVLEALYRLYQDAFWAWLEHQDRTLPRKDGMYKLVGEIQGAFKASDRASATSLTQQLESEHITKLQALQQEFTAAGRAQSATFAYWDTFMQGVGILLRLLRAERDGLFELHLIAVCETMPWCRAADRGNYVKYLPGYLNPKVLPCLPIHARWWICCLCRTQICSLCR